MRHRLREYIIDCLNKNPEYCWPELVLWYIMDYPFRDLISRNRFRQKTCTPPHYYCGKCTHIRQRKDWIKWREPRASEKQRAGSRVGRK